MAKFDEHRALAKVWARHNGMRGTDKQLASIMKTLSVSELERMLEERGYRVVVC